jgi:hypothetical protein
VNPLIALHRLGQSLWVDDIRRVWLTDGTLQGWIETDGIAGVTSNPAIFEKAISQGDEYRTAVSALGAQGMSALQIYEALALEDVRAAADLFAPRYRTTAEAAGLDPRTVPRVTVGAVLVEDGLDVARKAHRFLARVSIASAGEDQDGRGQRPSIRVCAHLVSSIARCGSEFAGMASVGAPGIRDRAAGIAWPC